MMNETKNQTKESQMKANMSATMNQDETKVIITLSFTGHGWDNHDAVDREAKNYTDALEIGMKYGQGRYVAEVEPTKEACAPFAALAEKHGLEIIQL
jgi:hypothetical protein